MSSTNPNKPFDDARDSAMRYRRAKQDGGTYFFTLNLANRASSLLVDEIGALRAAFRTVMYRHPFVIDAVVILPDHLHLLCTLPPRDADFPTRLSLIKAGFSRRIPNEESTGPARRLKGERAIWQRRYWEHLIRDERDFRTHIDYIHFNPVKHGYVNSVRDWSHSSFHRFVANGVLPVDWGGNIRVPDGGFGEASG